MAKASVVVAKQPPVHEVDPALNRHRIVTFRNGIPERGDWFGFGEIATGKGSLLAMTQERAGLPVGIFRTVGVAHEVL